MLCLCHEKNNVTLSESICKHLDGYIDVFTLLKVSSLNKSFRKYHWKLTNSTTASSERVLNFSYLNGHSGKLILQCLNEVINLLDISALDEGLVLDFSGCVGLKDSHIAAMFELHSSLAYASKTKNDMLVLPVKKIILDYVMEITDFSLEVLLRTPMLKLQSLSLKGINNEKFTGAPFMNHFTYNRWPKFEYLDVSFSRISKEVVKFLCNVNVVNQDFVRSYSRQSIDTSDNSSVDNREEHTNLHDLHDDDIIPRFLNVAFHGSIASLQIFEECNLSEQLRVYEKCIKDNDYVNLDSIYTKLLDNLDPSLEQSLVSLLNLSVKPSLNIYLSNLPFKSTSTEVENVFIWTYPIIIAIKQNMLGLLDTLIKLGADVNILDFFSKSVLFRAVQSKNYEVTKFLLKHGCTTAPIIPNVSMPLNYAILNRDFKHMDMLLDHGYDLNVQCPAISNYKSPLYVACEAGCEQATHLLLDWGANPNEYQGSYKNSSVMMAYKSSIRLLYVFLHSNEFKSINLAVEVLTSAIAKNDIGTVKVLVNLFPALALKRHPIWSVPHVHISRLGNSHLLKYILSILSSLVFPGIDVQSRMFPACSHHSISDEKRDDSYFELTKKLPVSNLTSDKKPGARESHTIEYDATSRNASKAAFTNREFDLEVQAASVNNITSLFASEVNMVQTDDNIMYHFLHIVEPPLNNTALHFAAEAGHLGCVKILLRFGFRLDLQNSHGDTPLHLACAENHLLIVAYMLCCGANAFSYMNAEADSPFVTALKNRNDNCCFAIIEFLSLCRKVSSLPNRKELTLLLTYCPIQAALKYHRLQVLEYMIACEIHLLLANDEATIINENVALIKTILSTQQLTANHQKLLEDLLDYYTSLLNGEPKLLKIANAEKIQKEHSLIPWHTLCLCCTEDSIASPVCDTPATEKIQADLYESRLKKFQQKIKLAAKKPFVIFGTRS